MAWRLSHGAWPCQSLTEPTARIAAIAFCETRTCAAHAGRAASLMRSKGTTDGPNVADRLNEGIYAPLDTAPRSERGDSGERARTWNTYRRVRCCAGCVRRAATFPHHHPLAQTLDLPRAATLAPLPDLEQAQRRPRAQALLVLM